MVDENFKLAKIQYHHIFKIIGKRKLLPRTIDYQGNVFLVGSNDWTSGFFPGALWYIFEYTQDDFWKNQALNFSMMIEDQKYNSGNHDIGFKINHSIGHAQKLFPCKEYEQIIVQSADTLLKRYNANVGCTRSWDHFAYTWRFPVIIDNLMNLELLFHASRISGKEKFYNAAVCHADRTMEEHFREDFSSYHVVNFDPDSGRALHHQTAQGYSHESAWARGQAWALYGYTMIYRETKEKKYLNQAEMIAKFILNHKNLPKDKIPYWDFDDPKIPHTERDSSAAAIISSALYELSNYVEPADRKYYLDQANLILKSLSSSEYRAKPGENSNFILKHCVGDRPYHGEVDIPIIYADYYFLEANFRKYQININQSNDG